MNKYRKTYYVFAYKALNLGDDLFLHILFRRYPNIHFVMLGNNNYSNIFSEYTNVHIISNKLCKILNYIDKKLNMKRTRFENIVASRCYGAIIIGGSLFREPFYPHFYNNLLGNKPLFLLGANFGPYKSLAYFDYCNKYICNIDDICFRDKYSYNLFRNSSNCRYAPDIVFLLNTYFDLSDKACVQDWLFISVMNFRISHPELAAYQEEYEKMIIELINKYIRMKKTVILASFCDSEGDSKEISILLSKMNYEQKEYIRTICYNGYNIMEFLNAMNNSRLIVGTRFHSIVLGLSMGKNVIPISYSKKTKEMLEDLNLGSSIINLKDISHFRNDIGVCNLMTSKLERVRQCADGHFSGLDKELKI